MIKLLIFAFFLTQGNLIASKEAGENDEEIYRLVSVLAGAYDSMACGNASADEVLEFHTGRKETIQKIKNLTADFSDTLIRLFDERRGLPTDDWLRKKIIDWFGRSEYVRSDELLPYLRTHVDAINAGERTESEHVLSSVIGYFSGNGTMSDVERLIGLRLIVVQAFGDDYGLRVAVGSIQDRFRPEPTEPTNWGLISFGGIILAAFGACGYEWFRKRRKV